ncbi:MAG: hypothetical protein ACOYW3_05160 [Bacteroidota bacterium]
MAHLEFHTYSIDRQIQILYEQGVFVMGIRYYGYKINLYLLGNFYVEVFYNHKQDFIEKIIPWDATHSRTKFYVDQIKLPVI